MKIIVLTQYYPPEAGAPQNRLSSMAAAFNEMGAEVTVLTAMPNYPEMVVHEGYRRKFHVREELDGITVHRSWIHASRGRSLFARLMNYFSFVFTSLVTGLFVLRRSDVLLVESPPLFLGISAMLLARVKRANLVFNVSDLWPESAVQLGLVKNRVMIGLSTWLEMRCYRRAALITGQTQGIVQNIQLRCPDRKVLWVPNGMDVRAVELAGRSLAPAAIRMRHGLAGGDMVVAYAGILGHAQGLEVVLQAARLLKDRPDIAFIIVGDGPEKRKLLEMKEAMGLAQVRFLGRMPRQELLELYRTVDVVVVPLRRNDLFKGAIPSKIVEALAMEKPVLLGVEGEACALFIDDARAGLAFTPEDPASLADAVLHYYGDRTLLRVHGASGARYVRERFDRAKINAGLFKELQQIGGGRAV